MPDDAGQLLATFEALDRAAGNQAAARLDRAALHDLSVTVATLASRTAEPSTLWAVTTPPVAARLGDGTPPDLFDRHGVTSDPGTVVAVPVAAGGLASLLTGRDAPAWAAGMVAAWRDGAAASTVAVAVSGAETQVRFTPDRLDVAVRTPVEAAAEPAGGGTAVLCSLLRRTLRLPVGVPSAVGWRQVLDCWAADATVRLDAGVPAAAVLADRPWGGTALPHTRPGRLADPATSGTVWPQLGRWIQARVRRAGRLPGPLGAVGLRPDAAAVAWCGVPLLLGLLAADAAPGAASRMAGDTRLPAAARTSILRLLAELDGRRLPDPPAGRAWPGGPPAGMVGSGPGGLWPGWRSADPHRHQDGPAR